MVPRVNNPQGVRTPDYLFRGEAYDLKTLQPGAGENTIYYRVKNSVNQAHRFVVDVTDSGLPQKAVVAQLQKVFWASNTRTVQEIVIVRDGQIEKVAKRKN